MSQGDVEELALLLLRQGNPTDAAALYAEELDVHPHVARLAVEELAARHGIRRRDVGRHLLIAALALAACLAGMFLA